VVEGVAVEGVASWNGAADVGAEDEDVGAV
jgi:hypothetical protein